MDSEAILERARSGQAPSEWNVWPLRRDYVRISAFKWALLAIVGFAILIPVALTVIPADFVGQGVVEQSFAAALLLLLCALAFGSLGIAAHDVWRLARANAFWLVITPETFVKAGPRQLIETPLEHVANLTLKGVPIPTEGGNSENTVAMSQFMVAGRLVNFANRSGIPGVSRQRARGSASLAYRDSRDNKVITVCTDDSFDQMAAIYELLRDRAAAREEKVWRASLQSPLG
ncbi:MAG TPA: hypothetical protein VE338_18150 [Ktedonobacterales bacterium]|jgi:hypothetical protein|nr:hypothetical protein [Ktedonobacterales bacterium]